jgi:hypothetical protein
MPEIKAIRATIPPAPVTSPKESEVSSLEASVVEPSVVDVVSPHPFYQIRITKYSY